MVNKAAPPDAKGSLKGFTPVAQVTVPEHTFSLKGDLGRFLGHLERYRLAITLEGEQGSGKTQFAFQLADGFSDLGMKVGFYSLEIGTNSTVMVRNRDLYLQPKNHSKIFITEQGSLADLRQKASVFDVVIIDSWTKLDEDSKEFDRLRKDFPNTIWVVIFQRTSANKIRGGTKPLYDAGINIAVYKIDNTFENNYAECTKNRYGETGLKFNVSGKYLMG